MQKGRPCQRGPLEGHFTLAKHTHWGHALQPSTAAYVTKAENPSPCGRPAAYTSGRYRGSRQAVSEASSSKVELCQGSAGAECRPAHKNKATPGGQDGPMEEMCVPAAAGTPVLSGRRRWDHVGSIQQNWSMTSRGDPSPAISSPRIGPRAHTHGLCTLKHSDDLFYFFCKYKGSGDCKTKQKKVIDHSDAFCGYYCWCVRFQLLITGLYLCALFDVEFCIYCSNGWSTVELQYWSCVGTLQKEGRCYRVSYASIQLHPVDALSLWYADIYLHDVTVPVVVMLPAYGEYTSQTQPESCFVIMHLHL